MKILSRRTLREFWELPNRADAEQPLKAWYDEAKAATWRTPQDVKDAYRSASVLANNRVVFNIAGNKYRLVVAMDYPRQWCKVRFLGTHREYDNIDATII
jgi:mRNA interferase HigB